MHVKHLPGCMLVSGPCPHRYRFLFDALCSVAVASLSRLLVSGQCGTAAQSKAARQQPSLPQTGQTLKPTVPSEPPAANVAIRARSKRAYAHAM